MLNRNRKEQFFLKYILLITIVFLSSCFNNEPFGSADAIEGLTGKISNVKIEVPANASSPLLEKSIITHDIDLKRMAQWAMNYLIRTPRKQLNYQPVFQCHPLKYPPVPSGNDVIVNCDTDARLNWEWYYMRDVSGSTAGKDVEMPFHKRLIDYVEPDGGVWTDPGCYNEANIHAVYKSEDYIYHTWGATKILKALSEDYIRTGNKDSKELAQKVMLSLKKEAIWINDSLCYFKQGMGALKRDGSVLPSWWNQHPAPIVEPLITYYLATKDKVALDFAKAYAEGIVHNIQPNGLRFETDGSFKKPLGHSHATMHAVWGVAHLGVVIGKKEYIDFAKRCFDWMLSRGTGTGWFPAMPSNCNETCHISDMISNATCIAQGGYPQYYDYAERYMRNYISNLQFIVTDEFKQYYRGLNYSKKPLEIESALKELEKFQGGIIGGSGLNDFENQLLDGVSGFEMFGCCTPEGMRAIYTTWSNTIFHNPASSSGPEGVYVNMSFNVNSPLGEVTSFMPTEGRITVKAKVRDVFFLRPPHWASKSQVHAFINARPVETKWSGEYVRLEAKPDDELTITYPLVSFLQEVDKLWEEKPNLKMTFHWLGNMVVSSDPAADQSKTALFTGRPRILPLPPTEYK